MQNRVIAKAVLINEQDKVLLLRRSKDDDRRPGELDFPGGSIELGEDFTAGVQREINEEAGLHVPLSMLTLFYTKTEIYHQTNIIRLVYWARVVNAQIILSFEHDDFHWAPLSEVANQFPHPVYGVAASYGLSNRLFM